jgi:hypothetical protein
MGKQTKFYFKPCALMLILCVLFTSGRGRMWGGTEEKEKEEKE